MSSKSIHSKKHLVSYNMECVLISNNEYYAQFAPRSEVFHVDLVFVPNLFTEIFACFFC